jgi:hypothetical protein
MVFDHHGQALVGGIERRSLGNGPGFQHVFHLKAKIIVQVRGPMFLHDKAMAGLGRELRRRLGSLAEVALALIFFERHRALDVWRAPHDGALISWQSLHGVRASILTGRWWERAQ